MSNISSLYVHQDCTVDLRLRDRTNKLNVSSTPSLVHTYRELSKRFTLSVSVRPEAESTQVLYNYFEEDRFYFTIVLLHSWFS